MDKELFIYPKKIPKHIKQVPMYVTTKYRTYSRRETEAVRALDARIKRYSRLFKIKSKPQDVGDLLVFREKDYTLEVYKTSDSVWWTHNELAYRGKMPRGKKLPDKKAVVKIARRHLAKFGLTNKYTKISSVDYTEVAIAATARSKPRLVKTEAHAIFNFFLGGLPVMGPGAKIKVSLVEDGKLSSLLYFWRDPVKRKAMKLVHPKEGLGKLINDPRFMRLSSDSAVVQLRKMRFGYYALTPTEFQRYLIPVYETKGTVKTSDFERYDFTHYIAAVALTQDEIKRAGILADPSSCQIF